MDALLSDKYKLWDRITDLINYSINCPKEDKEILVNKYQNSDVLQFRIIIYIYYINYYKTAEKLLEQIPIDYFYYQFKYDIFYKKKQYDKLLDVLNKQLNWCKANKNIENINECIGYIYLQLFLYYKKYRQKDTSTILEYIELALNNDLNSQEILYQSGLYYYENNKKDIALKYFNKLNNKYLEKNNGNVYYMLFSIYYNTNDNIKKSPLKALEYLDKAVELNNIYACKAYNLISNDIIIQYEIYKNTKKIKND